MVRAEKRYTDALRSICEKTDYVFFIQAFRGYLSFLDPWFEYNSMDRCIQHMENPCKATLKLLQMGAGAPEKVLEEEIGAEDIQNMIDAGIWRREEDRIESNNFVVIAYQGLLLLVENNPWFPCCTKPNMDVYIGSDSYRLAENIGYQRGETALDLCSGSGIQGILSARIVKKVVSVELNEKAVPVTRFNILLNNCEDKIDLRTGDLYSVLKEGERFDCIYANPPFIPMADDVEYPICGTGGEDGLRVLRRILEGLPERLNPGGEAIIFCECLGDAQNVFFDADVEALGAKHGWQSSQVMRSRMEGKLQIVRMAELSGLFDANLDKEDLSRRMSAVYENLGATYLYSLLYRIRNTGSGDGKIRHLRQYNQWDMDSTAQCRKNLTIGMNKSMQSVWVGEKHAGLLSREKADILAQLCEGKTVQETAQNLWETYQNKPRYAKEGYPAFLTRVLESALSLENIGVISRKK